MFTFWIHLKNLPTMRRSFQVIPSFDQSRRDWRKVLHDDNCDFTILQPSKLINPVDVTEKTIRVLLKMTEVIRENAEENLQLLVADCLEDELFIVCEEDIVIKFLVFQMRELDNAEVIRRGEGIFDAGRAISRGFLAVSLQRRCSWFYWIIRFICCSIYLVFVCLQLKRVQEIQLVALNERLKEKRAVRDHSDVLVLLQIKELCRNAFHVLFQETIIEEKCLGLCKDRSSASALNVDLKRTFLSLLAEQNPTYHTVQNRLTLVVRENVVEVSY